MNEPISTATPGSEAPATPETGTETPANGNGQLNGEAGNGQSATGSDSFLPQGLDLKTLPPALRAHLENVNKEMVRGFTEKTTKLSETIKAETAKAVASYKEKAEFYDQFVAHEDLVKYYNDYANRLQQKATMQQETTGHVDNELKQEIQQIKTELATSKTLEIVNAFAEAKDEKGNLVHPDFEKLSGIKIGKHDQGGEIDILRTAISIAPGKTPAEKLENGYRAAKAAYDSIFEEGRKAGMGRLQAKAKNGSLPPSSSAASSTASRRPKDALEALQFARQGLVPQ